MTPVLICLLLHFFAAPVDASAQLGGDCNDDSMSNHHALSKRSLFLDNGFNTTYALVTLDRLYGPKTYMQQVFVAGTNMVIRQVVTGIVGNVDYSF